MKNLLSSLVLAASLSGCYATAAGRTTPTAEARVELDRAQVRAKLAERRNAMIGRFVTYREARVYPIIGEPGFKRPTHTWFDDVGHLCAAATLVSGDWGHASTMKVGIEQRSIVLAKATNGELADWMLTSGLTHAEIVAIQIPPMGDLDIRESEIERLYTMYTDVERQLVALFDENLDLATERLMKRPDLARGLLAGKLPGPGRYLVEPGEPAPSPAPLPNPEPAVGGITR